MYRIPITSVSNQDKARLQQSFRLDANGCWVSTLPQNGSGYSQINMTVDGVLRRVLTHRASYVAFVGPIPDGFSIDHLCRNRACFNPDHLEAVSQSVNVLRGVRVNVLKTECKHGHPFDEANTYYPPSGAPRQCRSCIRNNSRDYQRRRRLALRRADSRAT